MKHILFIVGGSLVAALGCADDSDPQPPPPTPVVSALCDLSFEDGSVAGIVVDPATASAVRGAPSVRAREGGRALAVDVNLAIEENEGRLVLRVPVCNAGTGQDLRGKKFTARVIFDGPTISTVEGEIHAVATVPQDSFEIGSVRPAIFGGDNTLSGKFTDSELTSKTTAVDLGATLFGDVRTWQGTVWIDDVRILP